MAIGGLRINSTFNYMAFRLTCNYVVMSVNFNVVIRFKRRKCSMYVNIHDVNHLNCTQHLSFLPCWLSRGSAFASSAGSGGYTSSSSNPRFKSIFSSFLLFRWALDTKE